MQCVLDEIKTARFPFSKPFPFYAIVEIGSLGHDVAENEE